MMMAPKHSAEIKEFYIESILLVYLQTQKLPLWHFYQASYVNSISNSANKILQNQISIPIKK